MNQLTDARILIADDHEANVVLLEQMLLRAGATDVHATTSATEVVALFERVRPDIVLLDLHMPGMDGVEVMSRIRASLPADEFVPIVFLTADITTEARNSVLASGANDFLTKPIDRTEVILRLQNLLHTRGLHRLVRAHNLELRHEIAARDEAARAAMEARARKRARIQDVIDAEAVSIVFQPIVQLRTGDTVAYEALSRFPGEPTQSPALWFAEAFEVGLGEELELLALRGALQALDQLPSACNLCVNISPATARSDGFATLLAKYPIERLFVEITEHASIDDYESLHAALERAGGGRIRLAVDDAGAGYASLNHILQLHPRAIKLDISLVRGIDTDPVKRALAWSLMVFGREIDAVIVAEGIETAGELVCLRELGIGWGQGYHLGRPGPLPA